jgi:hypothetical protein
MLWEERQVLASLNSAGWAGSSELLLYVNGPSSMMMMMIEDVSLAC